MNQRYHKYGPNSSGHCIGLSDREAFGGVRVEQFTNVNMLNRNNRTTNIPNNYIDNPNKDRYSNVGDSFLQNNMNNNYAYQNRYNNNGNSFLQSNIDNNTYHLTLANSHYLSPAERDVIQNSPKLAPEERKKLLKYTKKGDDAKNRGDFAEEAKKHRLVQETLKSNDLKQTDDESQKSYSYNSAIRHVDELVEKCTKRYGLTFEEMFSYHLNENPNYGNGERRHNYYWKVPDKLISMGGLKIENEDPLRNTKSNLAIFENALKIKEEKRRLKNIQNDHSNLSESIANNMSAMDRWIDNYEKKNGLPRSYQNYNNNVYNQNYGNSDNHDQQNKAANLSGMMTMDEWIDNYERKNGLHGSYSENSNSYACLGNLNYLGIPKRTWD